MDGKILSIGVDIIQEGVEAFYVGEHAPTLPEHKFPFRKYKVTKVFPSHGFFDLEILKEELGYPSVLFSEQKENLKQVIIEYNEVGFIKKLPIHHEQENLAMMLCGDRVAFKILYRTIVNGKITYFDSTNGTMAPVAKIILSEL